MPLSVAYVDAIESLLCVGYGYLQLCGVGLGGGDDSGVTQQHLLITAACHIVDGVELGNLLGEDITLGGEGVNHIVCHIAQTRTLLARDFVERVVHILLGVAILGEDGLVDVHRVELHLSVVLYVGIHQHSVVENLRQLLVRYHLGAVAGDECDHTSQSGYYSIKLFHRVLF